MPDSDHGLADTYRMAAVLDVVAEEVEAWGQTAEAKGSSIVALTLKGVGERLRAAGGE